MLHESARAARRAGLRAFTGIASFFVAVLVVLPAHAQVQRTPVPPLEETGFQSIFDGKTLTGWDCDPDFWSVKDGAILGQSTMDHQPKQNTFCIWKGARPGDFELKLEYRMTGVNDGNSG